MRWPWRRRRTQAKRVDEVLRQAQEQCERAERVADQSERVRQRNHFSEAFERTVRRVT